MDKNWHDLLQYSVNLQSGEDFNVIYTAFIATCGSLWNQTRRKVIFLTSERKHNHEIQVEFITNNFDFMRQLENYITNPRKNYKILSELLKKDWRIKRLYIPPGGPHPIEIHYDPISKELNFVFITSECLEIPGTTTRDFKIKHLNEIGSTSELLEFVCQIDRGFQASDLTKLDNHRFKESLHKIFYDIIQNQTIKISKIKISSENPEIFKYTTSTG